MLSLSKNPEVNYLAKIVKLGNVVKHPNADKLQIATVDGCAVITGLQAKKDDVYVYFCVESVISEKFLSWSNSYAHSEKNANNTIKGFFCDKGRVRMIKLRNIPSEGYIVPVEELVRFVKEVYKKKLTDVKVGTEFDVVCGEQFVTKYTRPVKHIQGPSTKSKGSTKRYASKLVEKQFSFHVDTRHLKRDIDKISPDDLITITNKMHGCNFVVAHVLTKRQLNWREKIAKAFGVQVVESEYGMLYSSRTCLKNSTLRQEQNHFYDHDIWKIVADQVFPCLKRGITVYGEIYGYTPSGKAIQPKYDYGCKQNELGFVVFRATYTNVFGDVLEMTWPQLKSYCDSVGLKTPENYFYGKAKDLFPEIDTQQHWHENFLQKLCDTFLEKDCHLCVNKVPAEGVVISKQNGGVWEAYKLKSLKFLEKETADLDKGEFGIDEDPYFQKISDEIAWNPQATEIK